MNFRIGLLLTLVLMAFQSPSYGKTILKVKGKKIVFSLKGLPNIGKGAVISIHDSGVQIGKAKVTKRTKTKALAIVYQGVGLVDKGYSVKVITRGKAKATPEKKKKIKYNKGKKKKKGKTSEEKEEEVELQGKFAVIGTLSYLKMGEPVNGRAYDPTEFGSYIGYGLEFSYKWTSMFSFLVGIDYHFASGVTTLPAHSKNASTAEEADGNLSDIYLGSYIYFDDYDLKGFFLGLGYIPTSGHKLGTTSNLIIRYSGTGYFFGGGYEIRSGKWLIQFLAKMNSYSYSNYENNTESTETISISQKTMNFNFKLGYTF